MAKCYLKYGCLNWAAEVALSQLERNNDVLPVGDKRSDSYIDPRVCVALVHFLSRAKDERSEANLEKLKEYLHL